METDRGTEAFESDRNTSYTECFKTSSTTSKAYKNVFRGHVLVQCLELS
jgi:hypothetical protein